MDTRLEIGGRLATLAQSMRGALGANLHSMIVYGSAVRGDLVPKVSDINILIVLEESTSAAHRAITDVLPNDLPVSPLVLGRRGMERTIRAFAPKFLSIRRNYRVLDGADFLADLRFEPVQERFLVEQALRSHRMRLTHGYITLRRNRRRFTRFILRLRTGAMTQIAEALRIEGIIIPADQAARIPVFGKEMEVDGTILLDLTRLKQEARPLRAKEVDSVHSRLLGLLDGAITWIERRWPTI